MEPIGAQKVSQEKVHKYILDLKELHFNGNYYTIIDNYLIVHYGRGWRKNFYILDLESKEGVYYEHDRDPVIMSVINFIADNYIDDVYGLDVHYYDYEKDLLYEIPELFLNSALYKIYGKKINKYSFFWIASDRAKSFLNFLSTYRPDVLKSRKGLDLVKSAIAIDCNFKLPKQHVNIIKSLSNPYHIISYFEMPWIKVIPADILKKILDTVPMYVLEKYDSAKELIHAFEKYGDSLETHADYLSMRRRIASVGVSIDRFPVFPTCKDLTRLHDDVMKLHTIYVVYGIGDNEEKYNRIHEKNKFLEFSEGDYSIILPKDLSELVEEGNALHHCVGSYVESVANNLDVILFLRKDVNKPYVTINLESDYKFRQVHGDKNCNISDLQDYKEIDNFLKKWIKEKKLDLDSYNKKINSILSHS